MIGAETQAHRAAPLYLKCGRPWRALGDAKRTGDPKFIQYYQSKYMQRQIKNWNSM